MKIYLGYAAGVGKTYQMLEETQELKRQGRDVVIGYFEPHGRQDTISKTENLEFVPRRKTEYRGTLFEEMDVEAILRRRPEICVVDEFPHTNIPGSEREKRWQDVQVLLDSGIDVLTTMNVQHLESLNDQVWRITGVRVRETIPDWVMQQADQVVMVDLTPRALLNRLARGVVYPPEKAVQALKNFFRESTLVALRELALRQTAHEVEIRQVDYDSPGFESVARDGGVTGELPRSQESILILVTPDPSSAMLIRRGKRVADYLHADCFAVAVQKDGQDTAAEKAQTDAVQKHLNFARNLHIEVRMLEGRDIARTVVEFARLNGVTQLFLARPPAGHWRELGKGDLLQQVVRLARDMQVTIVADRSQRQRG